MITRDRLAEGLEILCLQLANGQPTNEPPDGWQAHEWTYLRGLASAAIWTMRTRFVTVGQA